MMLPVDSYVQVIFLLTSSFLCASQTIVALSSNAFSRNAIQYSRSTLDLRSAIRFDDEEPATCPSRSVIDQATA